MEKLPVSTDNYTQWQFTTSDYFHPHNIRIIWFQSKSSWKYLLFSVLVVAGEKEILMAVDKDDVIEKMAEQRTVSYCTAYLFTGLVTRGLVVCVKRVEFDRAVRFQAMVLQVWRHFMSVSVNVCKALQEFVKTKRHDVNKVNLLYS